jgi:leucyl aminopeptidase
MLSFIGSLSLTSDAFVIFVTDKYEYEGKNSLLPKDTTLKINSFIKSLKDKKNTETINSIDITEKKKCFVVKIANDRDTSYFEEVGGKLFTNVSNFKNINSIDIFSDTLIQKLNISSKSFAEFIFGFNLKSYTFNKYKTLNKNKLNKKIIVKIITLNKNKIERDYKYFNAIEEGVFLARDLVSEPPNVLNPKTYVQIIKKLTKYGLKIKSYGEAELKKLGLNALLGVGQGSSNESYLVVIEWNGKKNSNEKPLAFVGKGVCFDTGGISLKPAKFMEEMKYDMAGSAVVVGLLKSLALRKAKINAVGVVGLVENMPGSNAQRPGDIVKSYSGKTIEVLNTDAEGRLVLADALTFTEKKYNPQFIIDLATLTGAIIVSLGEEYAGLFSNNNKLAENIFESGKVVNEKVWKLPLHKNYDKLINSDIADVQNINYAGGAGSITAAQFLQRFILNKTPWAHLDIAGMAFSKKAANLNPGGATGFGVRLLNNLIREYYE